MSWNIKLVGTRTAVLAVLRDVAKQEYCHLPAMQAIQNIEHTDPKYAAGAIGVQVEGHGHVGGSFYMKIDLVQLAAEPTPETPPSVGDAQVATTDGANAG